MRVGRRLVAGDGVRSGLAPAGAPDCEARQREVVEQRGVFVAAAARPPARTTRRLRANRPRVVQLAQRHQRLRRIRREPPALRAGRARRLSACAASVGLAAAQVAPPSTTGRSASAPLKASMAALVSPGGQRLFAFGQQTPVLPLRAQALEATAPAAMASPRPPGLASPGRPESPHDIIQCSGTSRPAGSNAARGVPPGATMAAETLVKPLRVLTWPDAGSADWALVQQCATGDEGRARGWSPTISAWSISWRCTCWVIPGSADLSQEVFLQGLPDAGSVPRPVHLANLDLPHRRQSGVEPAALVAAPEASPAGRARGARGRARRAAGSRAASRCPTGCFSNAKTAGRVWHALDELPFDQRAVIVLREIDGLSYEEIATSLGVAVGTVKSRLARARESCALP